MNTFCPLTVPYSSHRTQTTRHARAAGTRNTYVILVVARPLTGRSTVVKDGAFDSARDSTISFPIPAPVHCDSFAFTLVFVSQNSVTLAPPSCTLTDRRNARRVIRVRLHLSVTVCKLLLDNRASFTTTNESPQTTL